MSAGAAPRIRPGTAIRPRGRERIAAILDAATALLVADGHAAFSIRKVAARAGVSLGNLQYYFQAKEDVVRALLERHLAHARTEVERRLAAAGDDGAALANAVRAVLADQENGFAGRFFVELWALAARDPEIAAAMRAFYAGYWRAVVGLLLRVHPDLGRAAAGRRAALVVAMLEGLTVFRAPEAPHHLPLAGLEDEAVAAAIALATAPPDGGAVLPH